MSTYLLKYVNKLSVKILRFIIGTNKLNNYLIHIIMIDV